MGYAEHSTRCAPAVLVTVFTTAALGAGFGGLCDNDLHGPVFLRHGGGFGENALEYDLSFSSLDKLKWDSP